MSDIDPWQRLRARIAILELTNNDLRAEVERLRAENERLREELRRIAAIDSSPRRTWIIEVENDFLAEVEKLRALPHCGAIYGVGSSTPQPPNMRPITEAQITELMAAIPRAEEVDRLRAEVERLRAALDRLARLGNEPHYGNSVGNEIARDALKEGGR